MAVESVKSYCNNAYLSISSIPDHIKSIPQTVKLKIDECSSTDFKIYGLVVIGALLQVAAVAGIAVTIVAATVASPWAFLGLIPAVAFGALGLYMAVSPEDIEDAICPPAYVPGQPIGLANRGNNCWANAGAQLLFNSPRLINSPAIQGVAEVQQLATAYTAAKQNQNRIVQNGDGQLVRNYLRVRAPQDFGPEQRQEDASEFLTYLFENHPLYQLVGDPVNPQLPGSMITVPLGEVLNPDFNQLLSDQFNLQDPNGADVELKFAVAPDDLLIHLGRFYNQQNPATGQVDLLKRNNPINIPHLLNLAPDYFVNNQGEQYVCDGFVVHEGHSLNGGHYVTYLRRPDNTWWLCSDRRVRQVAKPYVDRMIRQAYICHFSKLPRVPVVNPAPVQVPPLVVNPQVPV